MNSVGHCWPSVKRIAAEAGLSEKAVCKHLRLATTGGWIRKSVRKISGRRASHAYDICLPFAVAALSPASNHANLGGWQTEPQNRSTLNVVQSNLPTEHTNESAQGSPLGEAEFEHELWEIFPRNPASRRSAALSAFMALIQEDRVECILGAARFALRFESVRAGSENTEQRLRFVPSLATWIAQRRWERKPTE
jgi:hypothetical protein